MLHESDAGEGEVSEMRKMLCVGGSKHGQEIEVGAPSGIDSPLAWDNGDKDNTETYTVKFTADGKSYGLFEGNK